VIPVLSKNITPGANDPSSSVSQSEARALSPSVRIRRSSGYPWATISILVILLLLAVFGEGIAPHDMYDQDLMSRLLPPFWMDGGSWKYPLGTDATF
jgi:ABC-type antimicrobial peptide transport system permease subunit